jgi:hypothetical protein
MNIVEYIVNRSVQPRHPVRARLGSVSALCALGALQGCSYAPPYPPHVLAAADPWINSIRYLPDDELQRTCAFDERVLGCGNLTTGEIFVLDDPTLSDCVLQHERSHFREVFVERVAYEESAAHKRWYDHYCAD